MSNSYIFEKLMLTVNILATGKGRINDRLKSAVMSQFERLSPGHNDIPNKYTVKHNQIMKQLTCVKPIGDEGSLTATIDSLSEDESQEIAEKIVSLFHEFISDNIYK